MRLKEITRNRRWLIASSALTELLLSIGHHADPATGSVALADVFGELGRVVRDIADEHRMPRSNAAEVVQTLGAVSTILFGPAFETPYIEGFPAEGVIRLTGCPMFREERAELAAPGEIGAVCADYLAAAVEALNPDYQVTVSQARCSGDLFCEIIIEKR
jgi:hypothetical protein